MERHWLSELRTALELRTGPARRFWREYARVCVMALRQIRTGGALR